MEEKLCGESYSNTRGGEPDSNNLQVLLPMEPWYTLIAGFCPKAPGSFLDSPWPVQIVFQLCVVRRNRCSRGWENARQ